MNLQSPLDTLLGLAKGIVNTGKNAISGILNTDVGKITGNSQINATGAGTALNTVLGLPKATAKVGGAVLNFGKDVAQGMAREGVGFVGDVRNAIVPESQRIYEAQPTGFIKTLLGPEPVKTLASSIASTEQNLKASPFAQKYGINKFALPLAFAGTIGGAALDATPFGAGREGAIKAIAKSTDKTFISKALRSIGIAEDMIPSYAEKLVNITDEKQVATALDTARQMQQASKVATKPNLVTEAMQAAERKSSGLPPIPGVSSGLQTESQGGKNILQSLSRQSPTGSVPIEQGMESAQKVLPNTVPSSLNKLEQPVSIPQVFSKESPSLPNTVTQAFNPDKYVAEQVAKRETAKTVGNIGILGKAKSFLSTAKTKLVDFTAPIEDVLNSTVKKNDIKLLPEEDIHNQIDRVLRSPTLAGQFAKDNGIVDVIKNVDNLDNLDQYLTAKHAIELEAKGITTGRDLVKDRALVGAFSPRYEEAAKAVSNYSQKLLDYSVESGLISKDLADTLKARYPDYVPFQRVFSEIEKAGGQGTNGIASLSKQNIIQKIEGSQREIESPMQSLLSKTNDAFKQGEKNLAGKMLAGYEKLPGNPFQLKEVTGADAVGKSTISFLDNGKKRIFETTPEVAQAAKALDVQQLNILGRMLALPTRVARIGITGINIPFIGANIAKDQVTAFINSTHGLKTSIANPVNFVKSLFSAVGHDKLYEEMVRAGGAGTSFDLARNQVAQTVERIASGKSLGAKIKYTIRHPSELFRAVEDIIGRGEEFTRIQQYRGTKEALLKQGMNEKNAIIGGARQARDATGNFARRGEWGTVLNSAFLYLNAGIQGTRTLLGNLKTRPGQTAVKIAISTLFPVATITAWNMNDPVRKKAYDDIADFEKENNLIIVPPNPTKDANGKWNIIKIPLSQEINNLAGMVRRPIEAAYGSDPLTFGDFAKAISGTVSPVKLDKKSILSTATPQLIKPSIEWATNSNLFTGYAQVPTNLQKLSPENQIKPDTSQFAITLGKALGTSPIKIDAFVKGTFGGVGQQLTGQQNVLKAVYARFGKATGGKSDDKAVSDLQNLLMKQADSRDALKTQAETLDAELQNLPKEQAKDRFNQIYAQNPDLANKLVDVVEERKLGLTYEEKLMKQLGVENGERAKYIDEQIMKLPKEKRTSYYNDLLTKKIISPNVATQIQELKSKQKK